MYSQLVSELEGLGFRFDHEKIYEAFFDYSRLELIKSSLSRHFDLRADTPFPFYRDIGVTDEWAVFSKELYYPHIPLREGERPHKLWIGDLMVYGDNEKCSFIISLPSFILYGQESIAEKHVDNALNCLKEAVSVST